MKNYILLIITLGIFSSSHLLSVDIISYDVKVKYDTSFSNTDIKAKILLNKNDGNDTLIQLLFTNCAKISKIQLGENNHNYQVSYKFILDTIFINVPNKLKKSNNWYLNLDYQLPNDSIIINNAVSIFRSSKWCPLLYNVLSKWKIEIETPLNFDAFSSGSLIASKSDENHSYYTWEYDYNSGVPLIIVPKNYYTRTSRIFDNIEFNLYLINRDFFTTNRIVSEFSKSFHYYNNLLGQYKNKQLKIIEYPDTSLNGNFAMSLETFIVVGSNMLNYISYPQIGVFWVSHETVHQWIGSGYVNSFNTKLSWLIEEGLTEYVRCMYIENEYGKDSMNSVFNGMKDEFSTQYLNTPDDVPISTNTSDRIPYLKGPLVFHYIRNQIGLDNFIQFLRNLYNNYYGKVIDYQIFKSELSKFDKTGKVIKRMEEMTEMKGILPEK